MTTTRPPQRSTVPCDNYHICGHDASHYLGGDQVVGGLGTQFIVTHRFCVECLDAYQQRNPGAGLVKRC
jgi:hypothetical protein